MLQGGLCYRVASMIQLDYQPSSRQHAPLQSVASMLVHSAHEPARHPLDVPVMLRHIEGGVFPNGALVPSPGPGFTLLHAGGPSWSYYKLCLGTCSILVPAELC